MADTNKLTASRTDAQVDPSLMNRLLGALGQTWPARLAQDAWSGVTAPGDAYTGRLQVVDPQTGQVTDDAIARAASLAGVAMTGGVGGVPGEGAALGSGPIRAYHGSPHDFDAFDLSKIGTGEGAQAYGHGMYFAEAEPVAQAYRDALASPKTYVGGQPLDLTHPLNDQVAAWLEEGHQEVQRGRASDPAEWALQELQGHLRGRNDAKAQALYGDTANAIRAMQAQGLEVRPSGRMYEVGIHADPQAFLDWNAPLTAQSPTVQQALKPFGFDPQFGGVREVNGGFVADYPSSGGVIKTSRPFDTHEAAQDALRATQSMRGANPLGANIYESGKLVPGDYRNPAAATNTLQQAGIPGIKYLDQGSRGAGDGTRNYVVFNPQIVEIMRKYGVASMAALPPAVLSALAQGQDASQAQQPAAPVNRLLGPQT